MLFSRNWLRRYLELPAPDDAVADAMTRCGLVVDGIEQRPGDVVFDLDVPTNRVDAMNHLGVARELAVAFDAPLDWPPPDMPAARPDEGDTPADSRARVDIEDLAGCPRYAARVVLGVEVGPSPAWMADLLQAIGLRPLNNVVDITNFVLWEMGHPLHAFDLRRLEEQRIVVRRARQGEELRTLDEVERELDPGDLVIADADKPVALAGVMGGAHSRVDEASVDVLLEGAWFDPLTVRRMAQRLALHTDASHRFERRPAIDGMLGALDRAAALVAEIAGGTVCRGVLDAHDELPGRRRVSLTVDRVNRLLGLELAADHVAGILEALGFEVTPADVAAAGEAFEVTVPYSRSDVERPEDLVEEVARHHGYDRLPPTLPALEPKASVARPRVKAERRLQRMCAAAGYGEAVTMSLSSPAEQARFLREDDRVVPIANPFSEKLSVLRASLVPGLLSAVAHNVNRGVDRLRLFELGRCFVAGPDRPDAPADAGRDAAGNPAEERTSLAFAACGPAGASTRWAGEGRETDIFDLKGVLAEVTRRLGWPRWSWERADHPGLEPGLAAVLESREGRGWAGRVASGVADAVGVDVPVWVAEVDVDDLLDLPPAELSYRPLPRYPASRRDLSLLLSRDITFEQVRRLVEGDDGRPMEPLESLELVDIYAGEDIPTGHRSLTLRFTYRASDRTLTSDEVDAAHRSFLQLLQSKLDARQR